MSDRISRALAEYAAGVRAELSPQVEKETRRRLLDTLGVALGALREPGPQAVRRYVYRTPIQGGCLIWGFPFRSTPEGATLANGAALRYFDLNDTYLGIEPLHPSDMLSGLVAVGEQVNASGRELMLAVAVAYEVAVTLCDTLRLVPYGWDHVNITAIGATCGIGRLIGLDAREIEHALALTVIPHGAMRQTRSGELSMWKGLAAADAVRHSVYACQLAASGVEGPFQPFTGELGFVKQMLGGTIPREEALEPLKQLRPLSRLTDTYIKSWPVYYHAQSSVDAALAVRKRIDDPARIRRVRIFTFKQPADVVAREPEKWQPRTRETADHSLPYAVAAALLDGRITLDSFRVERITEPNIQRFLKERMTVEEAPELTAGYPEGTPTRVEVETDDGETVAEEVRYPMGHVRNPMSDERLQEKFLAMAGPVLGANQADRVCRVVGELEKIANVRDLTEMLVV